MTKMHRTPWYSRSYVGYPVSTAYPLDEVCTLDVIDRCTTRFAGSPQALAACQEGARDSYLISDYGRGRAVENGQTAAYAAGYGTVSMWCGGPYSSTIPF